ncbi:MAG: DUF1844 domain-containing protein [Candidatus Omnitrophica bacterium]|nr:DUF1844 domain-containing protein [Candidatus Omnitrophota bacterium]
MILKNIHHMEFENEKDIDESWKESAFSQQDIQPSSSSEGSKLYTGSDWSKDNDESEDPSNAMEEAISSGQIDEMFANYVTTLAYQSMIFLGQVPNPVTEEVEFNLEQAKLIIDTLAMIQEKTNGNLTDQEGQLLGTALYELQMKFNEIVQQASQSGENPS